MHVHYWQKRLPARWRLQGLDYRLLLLHGLLPSGRLPPQPSPPSHSCLLQDGFRDSFGLLLPLLAAHFSVGRASASLTSSIMTLLTLGSGPLVASLLPTFGHRTLSLLGALLATLGLLLAGLYIELASSPQILFLHLTVGLTTGLGFGLLYLPAMDIVEHYFSKRLGLAISVLRSSVL